MNEWGYQQKFAGEDAKIIFDVGANIGRTVGRYLELFPVATIYAFEPVKDNVLRLRKRLLKLHCGGARARVFEVAILDTEGETDFYLFGSDMNHSIHRETNSFITQAAKPDWAREAVKVPCTTLDRFCAMHGIEFIDVLKMDIEGAEMFAFVGAKGLLAERRIGLIYIELAFFPYRHGQTDGWDLHAFLIDHGFRFHSMWGDRKQRWIRGVNGLFVLD